MSQFQEYVPKYKKCLPIYGNTTHENWDVLKYIPIFYVDI